MNLEQIRIEWMEEKIKTPQTQGFSFHLFSASRRLCVENCFSIPSHQICSRSYRKNIKPLGFAGLRVAIFAPWRDISRIFTPRRKDRQARIVFLRRLLKKDETADFHGSPQIKQTRSVFICD
jgi:hypothetical protein